MHQLKIYCILCTFKLFNTSFDISYQDYVLCTLYLIAEWISSQLWLLWVILKCGLDLTESLSSTQKQSAATRPWWITRTVLWISFWHIRGGNSYSRCIRCYWLFGPNCQVCYYWLVGLNYQVCCYWLVGLNCQFYCYWLFLIVKTAAVGWLVLIVKSTAIACSVRIINIKSTAIVWLVLIIKSYAIG